MKTLRGPAAFLLTVFLAGLAATAPSTKPIDQAEADFERQDYAAVLKLAKPLADRGEARALVLMGQLAEKGLAGVTRDPEAALKFYRQASAKQLAAGRYHLARAYREGIGVEPDPARALRLCQSAADSGYPPAQALLGLMYSRGEGAERDYTQAVNWFEKAAALGDREAQYSLGFMYSSGIGLPKQLSNATRHLRMAAERGHSQAQYLLGLLLWSSGQGLTRDPVEAYALVSLAAEGGVKEAKAKTAEFRDKMPPAQVTEALVRARALAAQIERTKLGKYAAKPAQETEKPRVPVEDARRAFDSGKYVKARELALPLAEKGDVEALYLLGLLYERGLGTPKDLAKAFDLTRRSAEGGYAPAMYNLGVIYETGRPSAPIDLIEAYKWYSVAGARGDEDAFDKARTLAGKMKEEEIIEAKSRARDWVLEHKKAAPPAAPKDSGDAFQEFNK